MSNEPSADLAADLGAGLSGEDAKLVTLARATRARARAAEGAAVRDLDGRTYAAASVRLEHLTLSALEAARAGCDGHRDADLEAAVVLVDGDPAEVQVDVRAAGDFAGAGVPVLVGDRAGRLHTRTTTG